MLTDVPKAQEDQKVIIMIIHVPDGFQITVNPNETIVLPQGSGSLKYLLCITDYIAYINNYFLFEVLHACQVQFYDFTYRKYFPFALAAY